MSSFLVKSSYQIPDDKLPVIGFDVSVLPKWISVLYHEDYGILVETNLQSIVCKAVKGALIFEKLPDITDGSDIQPQITISVPETYSSFTLYFPGGVASIKSKPPNFRLEILPLP